MSDNSFSYGYDGDGEYLCVNNCFAKSNGTLWRDIESKDSLTRCVAHDACVAGGYADLIDKINPGCLTKEECTEKDGNSFTSEIPYQLCTKICQEVSLKLFEKGNECVESADCPDTNGPV